MKLDKETLSKAKKNFYNNYYRPNETEVTTITFLDEKGNLHDCNNHACHAGLTVNRYKNLTGIFSGIQKPSKYRDKVPLSEEARKLFIDWVLYHSPFRTALVNDTVDEAIKYQCLIGEVDDAPCNLMAGGLMTTRLLGEHPTSGMVWYEFVKHGVHPSLAFIYAHLFACDGEQIWEYSHSHTGTIYYSHINDNYIFNFLTNNPISLKQPYSESSNGVLYNSAIWQKHNNSVPELYKELFSKFNEATIHGSKSNKNPFAAAKVDAIRTPKVKIEIALDYMLPILNKYREYINE